jgi:hypothetical protein
VRPVTVAVCELTQRVFQKRMTSKAGSRGIENNIRTQTGLSTAAERFGRENRVVENQGLSLAPE